MGGVVGGQLAQGGVEVGPEPGRLRIEGGQPAGPAGRPTQRQLVRCRLRGRLVLWFRRFAHPQPAAGGADQHGRPGPREPGAQDGTPSQRHGRGPGDRHRRMIARASARPTLPAR